MAQGKKNPLRVETLLLARASQSAVAGWQTLGTAMQATRMAGGIELSTSSGARVRVSLVDVDTVRVRVSPTGAFERDFSYALAAPVPGIDVQVDDDPATGAITLRGAAGDSARVVISTRPVVAVAIYDAAGNEIVSDDPARPMAFNAASGAIEASKLRGARELYYGFGEKALPLARQQQYMTMWNTDAPNYAPCTDPLYQDIPFFIALRNGVAYGVFFDNTWRSYFDMGKTDPARYTFGADGGDLDYYVFSGGRERSPARVLSAYTALTGRMPLPPLWALGYQQSRYSYTPAGRVRKVAHEFRARGIPADVIYLDIDYMDGFRIFTWSPERFAEPKQLLDDLHALDFHPVAIVDPGIKVDDTYAIYRDGRDRGMFVRDGAGQELHAHVWPGNCAFPDFTDPKARAWFGSLYAGFLDQGVSGFWNDMDEPATFAPDTGEPILVHDPAKTFPLDARQAGDGMPGTHARYHNVYGMQMARATFEGLRKLRPDKRPLVLTRAGYAGVQRYSAVWTGDNVASWEHLALSIPMLASLSISGVPFVGADIGGYAGSPSAELYARWLQAAVLTPFFRTHAETGSADREPWSFGTKFERINRTTIELRYRLLPYLYTLFAQSERDGSPVMRPLWFDYPADYRTYLLEDEFLVGRDLLVAPVVREGETARQVYFPRGDDWIDWWDGTRHAGGTSAGIRAPIERLPLFVRAGASVPVQPVVQHTGAMAHTPLTVAVATGSPGEGSIYQDAGDGYGYRHGESRTIGLKQGDHGLSLDVPASKRFPRIEAVELLGLAAAPRDVRVDGKRADVQFDAATHRARIALPKGNVKRVEYRLGAPAAR